MILINLNKMVTTTASISANMIQSNNISPSPNITTATATIPENSTPTRRVGDNRRVSINNNF